MKGLFSGLIFFHSLSTFGQDLQRDYSPLSSRGPLPLEFVLKGRDKSQQNISTISESNKLVKKTKQEFVLKSTFVLDHLLKSGKVLFGDPVTQYVNGVADTLLVGLDSIRQKLHIYVTRSSEVNAYTFDNGDIFINIGLLSYLENEAQLAFILSHEITHFLKKHSINAYVQFVNIDKGNYSINEEEKDLMKSRFSKENESEADELGFELFSKTRYSLYESVKTMDVLYHSDQPFGDIEFDRSFLETPDLKFPDSFFRSGTRLVSNEEDYDDSKGTHPNIKKRKEALRNKVEGVKNNNSAKFLISENDFRRMREICRFELCHLYLQEENYIPALYTSYLLLHEYPANLYLKRTVLRSLYAISMLKSGGFYPSDNNPLHSSLTMPQHAGGSIQRLYSLIDKLSSKEMLVVALSYAWAFEQREKGDPVAGTIIDSLFSFMVSNLNMTSAYFYNKSRIDRQKDGDDIDSAGLDFAKYAFVNWINDDTLFMQRFNFAIDHKSHVMDDFNDVPSRYDINKEKRKKKKGVSLGIDRIVVVSPNYVEADEHHEDAYKYVSTDIKKDVYGGIVSSCANKLGIEHVDIDPQQFNVNETRLYNDYAVINEWINERLDHSMDTKCLVLNTDSVHSLVSRYGTKYFLWTGVVSVRVVKSLLPLAFIIPVYTIPYTIYYYARPEYQTLYYSLLIDMETGEVKFFDSRMFRERDSSDLLNTMIYHTLNQIKRKSK